MAKSFEPRVQCGFTNATNTQIRQGALDVERMSTTAENLPKGTFLVAVGQIAFFMMENFPVSNLVASIKL